MIKVLNIDEIKALKDLLSNTPQKYIGFDTGKIAYTYVESTFKKGFSMFHFVDNFGNRITIEWSTVNEDLIYVDGHRT